MYRLCALVFLLPAAAFADCAQPGDLQTGLRLVDAEGTVAVHRALPGNVVELTVDYGDGTGLQEERLFGLYQLSSNDMEDGQVIEGEEVVFSYEGGRPALPDPVELTEVQITSTLRAGAMVTNWTLDYRAGDAATITLDGCTYDAREITVAMQGPLDAIQYETYLFLPDLGIAHLAGSRVGNLDFPTPLKQLERLGP